MARLLVHFDENTGVVSRVVISHRALPVEHVEDLGTPEAPKPPPIALDAAIAWARTKARAVNESVLYLALEAYGVKNPRAVMKTVDSDVEAAGDKPTDLRDDQSATH